jgi:hypothetical protein
MSMLQPAFSIAISRSCKLCPHTSTSQHKVPLCQQELRLSTWSLIEGPFLPFYLSSCYAPIPLHATLFKCRRGTLAARRHHVSLCCAAIVVSRRPRWRLKAKMCTARYGFYLLGFCFAYKLIQAAHYERCVPPGYGLSLCDE